MTKVEVASEEVTLVLRVKCYEIKLKLKPFKKC